MNSNFKEEIQKYFTIENTRMIFDFMSELEKRIDLNNENKLYNGCGGLSNMFKQVERLSKEVSELLLKAYDDNGELLSQNPISSYISFWNSFFPESKIINDESDDSFLCLANIFNYYSCVKYLLNNKVNLDDLPYIYESICFSICNITESEMCYFVNGRSGGAYKIISQSGFIDSESDKAVKEYLTNYSNHKEELKDIQYLEGIKIIDNKEQKVRLVDFSFPILSKQVNTEFKVILKSKDVDNNNIDHKAIKVLFLRERMLKAVARDSATMMNLHFDSEYIKPINDDSLKVIHLSDLHITLSKKWNNDSAFLSKVTEKINREINVDLLCITGDVIQGASDAQEAQERYEIVGKVIFYIAKKVWGYKQGNIVYLPHDWKKRIIITSGNHDYAAMNDVIVQTQSRVIKTALPSKGSGGTMSKYTYLIEFLQSFLDLPMGRLIASDLNEIRMYRNLNTNVIVLNTSSPANSMQNNKVGINEEKIMTIISKVSNSKLARTIVLSHHSPVYDIDYFEDIYSPYNLFIPNEKDCEKTFVDNLYEAFKDLVVSFGKGKSKDFDKEKKKTLQEKLTTFDDIINKYQLTQDVKQASEDLVKTVKIIFKIDKVQTLYIDKWISLFCKSDLYMDIKNFCQYDSDGTTNEYSVSLFNKLYNIYLMQENDKKLFVDMFDKIIDSANTSLVFLAGHEHPTTQIVEDVKQNGKIVGKLFVSGKIENNYSIINISLDGTCEQLFVNCR